MPAVFFILLKDNVCQNALDLTNGQLTVETNFPPGTYCQWKISSQDENEYVTLVFHSLNVKILFFYFYF